jgi:hypothetical protein
MFETIKASWKLITIQKKQTELIKVQNALSKLEKINRKNEGKIQEQIVSLEKEIESLTGTSRPTRKQGVKIEEKTQEIFSGNSQTKEVNQKTKTVSNVFRYFLQDDTKKGVCSAQIKRIAGHKAIWKRSLNGKKNLYVAGIENMTSDKVDEVMAQFKNLDTYFVKSPYKAKIWSRN